MGLTPCRRANPVQGVRQLGQTYTGWGGTAEASRALRTARSARRTGGPRVNRVQLCLGAERPRGQDQRQLDRRDGVSDAALGRGSQLFATNNAGALANFVISSGAQSDPDGSRKTMPNVPAEHASRKDKSINKDNRARNRMKKGGEKGDARRRYQLPRTVLRLMGKSPKIESLMASKDWSAAERQIRLELRTEPDVHWLWERLGAACYEQRRYEEALRYAEKALEIMPKCSLALWDKAGALHMLGLVSEAIDLYRKLLRKGLEGIAHEPCSEGRAWTRALVSDSYYLLGLCYVSTHERIKAIRAIRQSLDLRGPGVQSLYPIAMVRNTLSQVQKIKPGAKS